MGIGAVLNTSFNIHGEPLVRAPGEAIDVFVGPAPTRWRSARSWSAGRFIVNIDRSGPVRRASVRRAIVVELVIRGEVDADDAVGCGGHPPGSYA